MQLKNILSEQVVYDEIAILNTRLQTDCQVPTVKHDIGIRRSSHQQSRDTV